MPIFSTQTWDCSAYCRSICPQIDHSFDFSTQPANGEFASINFSVTYTNRAVLDIFAPNPIVPKQTWDRSAYCFQNPDITLAESTSPLLDRSTQTPVSPEL